MTVYCAFTIALARSSPCSAGARSSTGRRCQCRLRARTHAHARTHARAHARALARMRPPTCETVRLHTRSARSAHEPGCPPTGAQAMVMTPDRAAVLVTSWHTNSIVRFNLTGGSREPVVWSGAANHGLEGPCGLAIGACVALRTERALRVIVSPINYRRPHLCQSRPQSYSGMWKAPVFLMVRLGC